MQIYYLTAKRFHLLQTQLEAIFLKPLSTQTVAAQAWQAKSRDPAKIGGLNTLAKKVYLWKQKTKNKNRPSNPHWNLTVQSPDSSNWYLAKFLFLNKMHSPTTTKIGVSL